MESYLDNRTREVKESPSSDSFSLPEINSSGKGEDTLQQGIGTSAGATVPDTDEASRFDPEAIQEVPIALEDLPEGKRPKVQLVMEDDNVSRVIVTCSCGECIELECNY